MEKVFTDSVYEIDLMYARTPADVVFDLSSVLDHDYVKNKKICLKIGNIDLNQAQLLSIKSLIQSVNSVLTYMVTTSKQTEQVAIDAGIIISKIGIDEINAQEEKGFISPQEKFPKEKEVVSNEIETKNETFYEASESRTYETMEMNSPINYPPEYEINLPKQEQNEDNSMHFEVKNEEADNFYQEPLIPENAYSQNENSEIINTQNEQITDNQNIDNVYDNSQNEENNEISDSDYIESQAPSEVSFKNASQHFSAPTEYSDVENSQDNQSQNFQNQESENQLESSHQESELYSSLNEFVEEVKQEEIKENLDNIFDSEKNLEKVFDKSENEVKPEYDYVVEEYTQEDHEIELMETKYVKQTLRSGQSLSFAGTIILIGDAHPGSEIIAKGDITVWGILGGIAHAGSKGNSKARIRALK